MAEITSPQAPKKRSAGGRRGEGRGGGTDEEKAEQEKR